MSDDETDTAVHDAFLLGMKTAAMIAGMCKFSSSDADTALFRQGWNIAQSVIVGAIEGHYEANKRAAKGQRK